MEIRPGASSYAGSTRNGVVTFEYGAYGGSYAFVGADGGLLGNVNDPNLPDAGSGDAGTIGTFDWSTTADEWPSTNGLRVTGVCPNGGSAGSVWGTDLYTDDSSVCTAAVHVGVITFDGGLVTFEVAPGAPSYTSSTRNGVTTNSYGMWDSSFVIIP
ncbi:MAG: hypothetical protein DI536_19450 [Archangium gephyra]|uniref:LCCL domain-containing protein n=1 Tax=Archangium gephyra TaxID=48 RepID=A0A2W5VJG5_9BACT|nr:MAG: hypothetical protein DI536_19450 [Archangium gephyra]